MDKHKAFSSLIGKKNGQVCRSSFSLSKEAVGALEVLHDHYQAGFKDIVRLILSDYDEHIKSNYTEGSCLDEILQGMLTNTTRAVELSSKKTLALDNSDLDALNKFCAEKKLNRNQLADSIINFALKCISNMENERVQNRKCSAELIDKWLEKGQKVNSEIAAALVNDEEASNLYNNMFNEIAERFKSIKSSLIS